MLEGSGAYAPQEIFENQRAKSSLLVVSERKRVTNARGVWGHAYPSRRFLKIKELKFASGGI